MRPPELIPGLRLLLRIERIGLAFVWLTAHALTFGQTLERSSLLSRTEIVSITVKRHLRPVDYLLVMEVKAVRWLRDGALAALVAEAGRLVQRSGLQVMGAVEVRRGWNGKVGCEGTQSSVRLWTHWLIETVDVEDGGERAGR